MNINKLQVLKVCFFISILFVIQVCQGQEPTIKVDFSKMSGAIKPLNGVNNGPLVLGVNADLSVYHAEAGFPFTRLHDPGWPSPDVVDIPVIFPNFEADPDDSNNYNFKKTDDYIAAIVKNNSEIIFRLGTSIEHYTQYYIHPPKDYDKWAKICTNIIRHYNEGWANGFDYNIKYWEIWNEPDSKLMWLGTRDQYFELYKVAANAIKKHDPSLKVGGPATTGVKSPIVKPFLKYCKENNIPLDFFTWHSYNNKPYLILEETEYIRSLLDDYGFNETENHLNEWHYLNSWEALLPKKDELEKFKHLRENYATTVGPIGAAYAASVLMLLQDSSMDVANFYSADTNLFSMFDVYGVPSKVYYAFKAFNQLAQTSSRVQLHANVQDRNIISCAGISSDKQKGILLISNYSETEKNYRLTIENFTDNLKAQYGYNIYMLDDKTDLELIKEDKLSTNDPTFMIKLLPYTVALITLNK